MSTLTKVPTLKVGSDAAAAKDLLKKFLDAQTGMRKIVTLGLAAWEIKQNLKHGEFGPWLAAHCPALAREDSATKKPKATHALSNYMSLTQGVLENLGFTVEKYFSHISKFPHGGICHGGKYLLLPDKKVPEDIKPLKEKICALIDGKTQKQLFTEFKQAVEDETGKAKPKRGNLSGKGCTKADREAAALEEERARIEELHLSAEDTAKWLLENSDHKRIGILDDKHFSDLLNAIETAHGYMREVLAARIAAKKGQS